MIKKSLRTGNIEQFIKIISSVFAGISYNMFVGDREGYYQTVIYLLLKLIGIEIRTEVQTNLGRLDAMIETEAAIYVIELKLGPAESALKQVKDKKYHEKYLTEGKPIHLVGIGFNPRERNISGFLVESVVR